MNMLKSTLIALSISLVLSSISVRRAGWLDRVVEYQKNRFIEDFMKQPVKITARLEKAPPGYVDSADWDYDSVVRLLCLIRDSESAAPVRLAIRRAMNNNRRNIELSESLGFSSLFKDRPNDFQYYEEDSEESYADISPPRAIKPLEALQPHTIIVVSNPVEAKLPSASISVSLLKSIMESRAKAGRSMPTTQINITWPVTPKRSITTKQTTTTQESDSASTSAATEVTTTDGIINATVTASGNETAVNGTSTNATET